MPDSPKIWVYIDETGDRGQSADASPIFGMAALLVSEVGVAPLRAAVTQLRGEFGVPDDRPMSWKKDAKNHDRRRRAAEILGEVPGIKVCYVYAVKDQLRADSYKSDPTRFYNYVAMRTYSSLLWAARHWKGDHARVWTRFGHVRRHDHRGTKIYLEQQAANDPRIPDQLEQGLQWVSADKYLESQAADLFGGFLRAATWPSGPFNYTEPSYLRSVWHVIRNSEVCAIPLGLLSMPRNSLAADSDWLPCHNCPEKSANGSSGASGGRST
ncbi:MAG TPA: DUF3800 domain-containing protein [Actinomycetales bacterium]|nr:DUF3800 domain-containing protein [Actinomycetales bacterium]